MYIYRGVHNEIKAQCRVPILLQKEHIKTVKSRGQIK